LLKTSIKNNEVAAASAASKSFQQLDMFNIVENEITSELKAIDILNITPIEAMNILYRLCKKTSNRS
jgi:DNA mismatch repair protein MutS